jgi:hypothetical protein
VHLWGWFVELSHARSSNGYSANPIGFAEIEAWARLTGQEPTPWEVSVLRRMDTAALEEMAKKSAAQTNGSGRKEFDPDDWEGFDKALGAVA